MKEHSNRCFSFTEREIHEVGESTNSFGEYLFVTVSCRTEQPKKLYTFWGLGYHEHRERWIMDTWQWYESQRKTEKLPTLVKAGAYNQIKEWEAFVRANATPTQQSRQAQLFELLADLTDEDGALSELEDLGWMFLNDSEE